jgi:hypothetical protein
MGNFSKTDRGAALSFVLLLPVPASMVR